MLTAFPDKCMIGFDKDFNPNHFLFERKCFLKDFLVDNFQAGNIINSFCSNHDINQRIIMVTMQREQGLIECQTIEQVKVYYKYFITGNGTKRVVNHPRPDQTGAILLKPGEVITKVMKIDPVDWCCGCGVPDDGLIQKYQGFKQQIEGAVMTYKYWFGQFKPGQEYSDLEGNKATLGNGCTFALLKYTPHLSVITLNQAIYKRFFGDQYIQA